MKRQLQMTVLALCMAAAPILAGAQPQSSDKKLPADLSRASTVIGTDVLDAQGKKIGDIKDVVLDSSRGQIAYAVVSFGGTLGMGSKYFAIPWKSLHSNTDNKYVLNVDQSKLKNAPGFDKDHWPDMASAKWNSDIHHYYNQRPYWQSSTAARRDEGTSSGNSNAGRNRHNRGKSESGSDSSDSK